ncbi:MAG: histidine triad protein [Alphaproteobacteria bacterium]|nr:histidine triad protein [Alphaproteobacteria bacterium]
MRLMLAFLVLLGLPAFAATPAAVTSDPPPDKAHPAAMAYVRIPSGGALLNGVLYTASGAGPHPALLLLHGFPGNEQNLDLAQAVRRAGFDVLTLHYRGSWGSPGVFSFAHAIQDSDAAVAFLKANAARYHLNPHRIFVAGHSMGGFMAASVAAHDPAIAGLVMVSAWDIGHDGGQFHNKSFREAQLNDEFRDDVIPLAGTAPDTLMDEAMAHARDWEFAGWAPALGLRPVLLISADDGTGPDSHRLALALGLNNNHAATEVHMATDHPYSDHRIALVSAVVSWLQDRLPRQ